MIITHEITEFLPPVAVIAEEKTENVATLIKNAVKQVPLRSETFASVMPKGYILFDFGKEISGGVKILTQIVRSPLYSAKIRVRFGESATEACSELGEKNSGNHHSTRDFTVNVQNLSEVRLGSTGFRFIRIDNVDDCQIDFLAVEATFVHSDAKRTGDFKSKDDLVDKIWNTAERTIFLNLQNGVMWDGIKRDRLVWAGDLYVEILSALYVYGDVENVANSLDMCIENVKRTGWANSIPSYSLWLVLDIAKYYEFTGDKKYLEKCFEFIDDLVGKLDICVGEDGLFDPMKAGANLTTRPYFIDWPTEGNEENIYAVEAVLRYALKKIIYLKGVSGKDTAVAEKVLKRAEKRKCKVTGRKSLNALQILFGGATDKEFGESLLRNGAEDISTFMAYFVLSAMFKAGYKKEALSVMKEYFSAMLDLGATTFFEDFDIKWKDECFPLFSLGEKGKKDIHGDKGAHCYTGFRHSFCHGWASGAVPFVAENVAGVRIDEAGCKKITVNPYTDFGAFECTVALLQGKAKIKVDEKGCKITAPKGVVVKEGD